jgi:hypothetical protein
MKKAGTRTMQEEAVLLRRMQDEAARLEKEARECPVPKPSGWVGRVLGFDIKQNPTHAKEGSSKV